MCIHWEDRERGATEDMHDMDDGNFLLKDGLDFRLEPYSDGQPAPKAPETASPFVLASSNLRDLEVVKARAKAVIAPALAYTTNRLALPSPRYLVMPCLGLPRGLGRLGT